MQYATVIEPGGNGYGAYVPNLPGCVAVATSREEVVKLIHQAIREHIQLVREDGLPVPEPRSTAGEQEPRSYER